MKKSSGHCLCGDVSFSVTGKLTGVIFCHCGQCLKTHGHFSAYTGTSDKNIEWKNKSGLTWYRSSKKARRGFCQKCGASLFYKPDESDQIAISAGCLEKPTKLRPSYHIYMKDCSDYYEVADQLPTFNSDVT